MKERSIDLPWGAALTVLFLSHVIKICVDGYGANGRITDRRGRLFQFPTNHPCLQRFTCRKFEKTCRDSKESVVRAYARTGILRDRGASWRDLWIYLLKNWKFASSLIEFSRTERACNWFAGGFARATLRLPERDRYFKPSSRYDSNFSMSPQTWRFCKTRFQVNL